MVSGSSSSTNIATRPTPARSCARAIPPARNPARQRPARADLRFLPRIKRNGNDVVVAPRASIKQSRPAMPATESPTCTVPVRAAPPATPCWGPANPTRGSCTLPALRREVAGPVRHTRGNRRAGPGGGRRRCRFTPIRVTQTRLPLGPNSTTPVWPSLLLRRRPLVSLDYSSSSEAVTKSATPAATPPVGGSRCGVLPLERGRYRVWSRCWLGVCPVTVVWR
jgi:hypothetical protein